MIQEVIVTTQSLAGKAHLAPMGIHVIDDDYCLIKPFKPSTTLDNLKETGTAVINCTDDVRVFAGCLTGRRDWPLVKTQTVEGFRLADTLSHLEVSVESVEEDEIRPSIRCRIVASHIHQRFCGFNRAQFAVLEAAILASRLQMLSRQKIESELEYLTIGFEKTAGDREKQAWQWIMEKIETYRQKNTMEPTQ